MKSISLIIILLVFNFSFGQNNDTESDKKMIIGKWISEEDNKYIIVVTKNKFIEYYGKEKTESFLYKIENGKLTKKDKTGYVYEYNIDNLTEKYLTLIYLPRGNTLIFKRKK